MLVVAILFVLPHGAVVWALLHYRDDKQRENRYLVALYWVVTTFTTVGYGDVTPSDDGETLFALLRKQLLPAQMELQRT